MIKVLFSFLIVSFFASCSASNNSADNSSQIEKDPTKTIFYSESYSFVNSSYKEDLVFLNESHLAELKTSFDKKVKEQLELNQFNISEKKESLYSLVITNFDFKEFKIQVDGPELNVITLRVDYLLKIGTKEKVLSEEINKESLEPFHETDFQEMCNLVATQIVNNVN